MTGSPREEELELAFLGECPRRIAGILHTNGLYVHLRCDRTGRIMCFYHESTLPSKDCSPSSAQATLDRRRQ